MRAAAEKLRASHDDLLTALDGHDSEAIYEASRQLSQAATVLKMADREALDEEVIPYLNETDQMMQASIYRLRFLRDHSATRLQLLSGSAGARVHTYSRN